jgi:hypothetical protein
MKRGYAIIIKYIDSHAICANISLTVNECDDMHIQIDVKTL